MTRRSSLVLGTCVLFLAALVSSAGAEQHAQPAPYGGAPPPTLMGKLELSLAEAVTMGLENNLNVMVQRHDPLIAFEQSQIAWGAYDPVAAGEIGQTHGESPNTFGLNRVQKNVTDDIGGFGTLRGLVPFLNAELDVTFRGNQGETNSTIEALDPKYGSDLTFGARIPLLKNLVWNEAWTGVKVSKIAYGISRETFRKDVMDVVQQIEIAYWRLIAAKQQVGVQQATLDTNRAQLSDVQTQYEVGTVSKVEVVQAEAGVAQAEFDLIVAENQYRLAQDQLIDEVLGVQLTPESRLEVEPTDDPADYIAYEIDVDAAVQKAFANRPELVIQQQQVHTEEVNLKFAKNQRLPGLDFKGTWGWSGVAGQNNPNFNPAFGTNPPVNSTFQNTFDKYFQDDGANSWSAKGIVTIPIGNVKGRHTVSQSQVQLRKAKTSLVRTRQQIILDVRTQARNLRAAQLGIEAADRGVAATAEQLRAEQIRLEHGESTPFDVLQRQEQFVRAQSQQIVALQSYQNAVTNLNRAQGTILSSRNIVIDDVGELR